MNEWSMGEKTYDQHGRLDTTKPVCVCGARSISSGEKDVTCSWERGDQICTTDRPTGENQIDDCRLLTRCLRD